MSELQFLFYERFAGIDLTFDDNSDKIEIIGIIEKVKPISEILTFESNERKETANRVNAWMNSKSAGLVMNNLKTMWYVKIN